ncbi:sporulation integral membrane protein YlbJ [Paenibacillus pini]|uniref:Membrane protein n=1 Tax=Paenibacillus pini JCM 16418 TaxID=1236976 RepID=W7YAC5_9BACL|nr:sporulation integral membrane protein YlbJ [Paenibacillus pini]GAF07995.1 membrane protein [Paenibacillus pini JCM 16418]
MAVKSLGVPLMLTFLTGLLFLMICFPGPYLEAALRGLSIWWDVLFPSLFPFFIISEMMLGFGVVHLMGTLLDPLMRPLFRIPGSGGFVAAMGYVSGYPIGAKLTAKLWEQRMLTRQEGERLVAFTTSSDPIFLIGAVSVGFFQMPRIAAILALAHYGGGLLIGLLMRFHGKENASNEPSDDSLNDIKPFHPKSTAVPRNQNRLKQALSSMHQARIEDGRNLGELLQQAIESSIRLIIVVGGLVVFFSVFLELMTQAGFMSGLNHLLEVVLSTFGLPPALSEALIGGVFEVTLGARNAAEAGASVALPYKVAAAAFILSWGGLSVHAQVASILHATNLRYLPFMIARFIHGILAFCLVLLCWNLVMGPSPISTLPSISLPASSSISSEIADRFMLWIILLLSMTFISLCWGVIRFISRYIRHVSKK